MELGKEFSEYKLHDNISTALEKLGFKTSTPIQDQAIPLIIQGQDVAGLAQTGTGKTAAFLLPLIERVLRSLEPATGDEVIDQRAFKDWQEKNFNLVLVPTRELAEQVKDCAMDFLKDSPHRVVVVYGGVSIEKQIEQLEKGFTFLIATPGRLIDLYKNHKVDLKQVRSATFDEADRMFDMGFKDDMKYILRRIPEDRQLLLFSATLNLDVFNVAYQFGSNPVEIKVSQDKMTAENVDDRIFHLGGSEKPAHLLGLINKHKPKQVIIFTNFKSNVERVAEFLNKNGHKAVGISSLLSQGQRKQVMDRFRAEGGDNILVATDVAARGLDIEGVDLVINYELPDDAENYVHRIGRTGRAGETGKAFSFVSDKDVEALDRIHKYLKRDLSSEWLDDEDLPKDFSAFPRGDVLAHKSRGKNTRSDGKSQRPRSQGRRREGGSDDRKGRGRPKSTGRKKTAKDNSENNEDKQTSVASGEEKSMHRDRRSGRHRNRTAKSSEAGRNPRNNRKDSESRKSSSQNKKSASSRKRKSPRKSSQRPSSSPAKSGVIGKITNAFRGLFR